MVKLEQGADLGRAVPGQHRDLGERTNRAQSLAAEPERGDREQVVERRQLGRRVLRGCK